MSDTSSNNQGANSPPAEGDGPDKQALAHVESPGIAPDSADDVANIEESRPNPAMVPNGPDPLHLDAVPPSSQGTALILAPARPKAETPPRPEPARAKAIPQFRWRSIAGMVAAAAVLGGVAGSLATIGVSSLTAAQPEAPTYYSALTAALGRVDHELTVLKSGVESSGKASGQIGKLVERLDRAEKAQADAGAKLAKATETMDRMERKFAAASGDVTGTVPETHVAAAATLAPGPDTRRPLPAGAVIEGWTVRDVYNGSAMLQSRAGIIQVIPGDNLPGLGRIEQVKRQEGRWVVVTSRGLILSH